MGFLSPRASLGSGGCKIPDHLAQYSTAPFVGNLSFYHFNMIVSGACTVVVLIVMFSLMARHATHMSNPNEQLKIMRICNLIPSYQVLSYVSIVVPNSYIYLKGFGEVMQGVALYSFVMLLCDFMAPTDEAKVKLFSSLEIRRQWQPKKKRNGLAFLKLTWYCVVQYPVITWIAAVSQVVTQALHLYCLPSTSPKFAHVWLEVATSLSTSIAVNAILQFYMRTKEHIKEHRPLLKLVAFKLAVGLVILEQIIFLVLTATGVLNKMTTLTYIDTMMGLPTMVICIQMVPISFFILYAYPKKPYEIPYKPHVLRPQAYHPLGDGDEETLMNNTQKTYQGGRWGLHAWAVYLNPIDIFQEVLSAYKMISRARAMQKAQVKEEIQEEMAQYETGYDNHQGA
ncbi:hypothetical protein N7478_008133 [Penicillium angulare]|uniref:uncharacterized protein n=1 Tax=Penicillium angulare TaxID=116970 RepID=UPI0025420D20|nr:uncharacterized protein N7478_008133 [Penicillium angulare]KAJ5273008.1 hypothetical protein N7478_008133 [Penicillium angulare]